MEYSLEKISRRIKEERKNKGLSQQDLGKKLHVSDKQISNYENAKLFPPIEMLTKMCEVFNCELGYLLCEEDYSSGTKLDTIITENYGLSKESLNVLNKLLGFEEKSDFEKECITIPHRQTFNALINSGSFSSFLEAIKDYLDVCSYEDNLLPSLQSKLGDDLYKKAEELYSSPFDYFHEPYSSELSKEQADALGQYAKAIDTLQDRGYNRSRQIAKFVLHESFDEMISSLLNNT